ncbi:hypothetical protein [Aquabacter spiritensis]|uniref:Secreted protein n=1 Tax=Aquabacter spiritensis TaxID=933073 RepID=A0A4R3LTK9_9HYPH|nr:hypothetical protein [Aquabacter spiritensis]TCT03900.1 hypothetical protein EDC64_10866 [Aquabacter spiritensis]
MRGLGAMVLGLGLFGTTAAFADAAKTGWWIRMDTAKTVAQSVELSGGSSRDTVTPFMTWKKGDAPEFDLPPALVNLPTLRLRGASTPREADVRFCVYYGPQAVEEFEFDGVESETMRQTSRDDCR